MVNKNKYQGFTFTEILVVLAIVAGITVLVIQQASHATDRSEIETLIDQIGITLVASKSYKANQGSYKSISMDTLIDSGYLSKSHLNDNNKFSTTLIGTEFDHGIEISEETSSRKVIVTVIASPLKPFPNEIIQNLDTLYGFVNVCADSGGVANCNAAPVRDGNPTYHWHARLE